MSCPALVQHGKRRGERCGKPIKGFVAPGEGRCSKHSYSALERAIARTLREARADAIGSMRALRALPPDDGPEHQEETKRDDDADEAPGFEWPGVGWTEVADEDVPR